MHSALSQKSKVVADAVTALSRHPNQSSVSVTWSILFSAANQSGGALRDGLSKTKKNGNDYSTAMDSCHCRALLGHGMTITGKQRNDEECSQVQYRLYCGRINVAAGLVLDQG